LLVQHDADNDATHTQKGERVLEAVPEGHCRSLFELAAITNLAASH